MRRYIVLLLITRTAWAQTGLDKLVLKDGTEYLGQYLKTEKGLVHFNQFKLDNRRLARTFSSQDVHTIQLKDGKRVDIELFKETNLNFEKYERLTIEEKAIYDAKKEALKWVLYPPLISSTGNGLVAVYHDPNNSRALIICLGAVAIYGSIKSIKKSDTIVSPDEIELYEKIYSKEFRKRAFLNFIASSVLTAPLSFLSLFWLDPWEHTPLPDNLPF